MRLQFLARPGSVPQYFRDHAEPRIDNLSQYVRAIKEVRVSMVEQRGRFTVEITVDTPRTIFRSEKRKAEPLEAFDEAFAAVEKQMRRHKRRIRDHSKTSVRKLEMAEPEPEESAQESKEGEFTILRTKRHASKPMTAEEAVVQMDMVGHDFFLFINSTTNGPAVVYRRHAGGYGLIELELG
jgi:putative sigma-54 modulation protein